MTEKTPDPAPAPVPTGGGGAGGKAKAAAAPRPSGAANPPPPPGAPAKSPATPARQRDLLPVLYLAGFVVLAAAILWLWQNPSIVPPPPPSHEVEVLRQQVAGLETRLTRLEQRPAPAIPAPPDLAPLIARITALENRKPPAPVDLGPLEAAVTALERRPAVDPALAARMDALAGRQDALTARVDSADAMILRRQDATDGRLGPLEHDAGQITALADRAARIARIQAAQAALDSGMKLGDLPGAPPALARYAAAPAPTVAALRLSFPAAAAAATAASQPVVSDKPFLDRAWARAQDLVTLRQGDHVILGDPAAGVLARARASLDAGDLAGAVAALGALGGAPAAAMSGWKAQAQGLLDARQALADMAARA
jgi:hypothetical protein